MPFRLNSGRRTEAEQRALIREKGVWSPSNPTGAAAYSPNAPHIRKGREDHALDVDMLGAGNARLTNWLRSKGLPIIHPIAAEPWHMETLSEGLLVGLAGRLSNPELRKGWINRSAARRLQMLLRAKGYKSVRVNGKYDVLTRIAVRRFQRKHHIPVTRDTRVDVRTWRALRR